MNTNEFWLIHSVAFSPCPIRVFSRDRQEKYVFFGTHPDLTKDQLAGLFQSLFKRGDMLAISEEADDEFTPSSDQIRAGLEGRLPFFYELTAQGGRKWEQWAKADWSKMIQWSNLYNVPQQGHWRLQVISTQKDMVEEAITKYYGATYWTNSSFQHWEVLNSLHVTYWKTLPLGHKFTGEILNNVEKPINDSYKSFLPRWYSVPWHR